MNLKSSPANSLVNLNRFKVVNLTGICTFISNYSKRIRNKTLKENNERTTGVWQNGGISAKLSICAFY